MNFHLKECMDWIYSLLKLIVTRWSADVICFILCLLRFMNRYGCHKLGHTQNN